MKSLKLAHNDGHTDVCYDSSGSFILTCGSDGKVCIWEGKDDTDTSSVNLGDKIFAIAFQGGRFFAATEENTIRIHTFPDGVSDGMVTRFTAPCRHFVVSDDGSMLVAGADDFKIKVISMEENECICLYSEHQAPILSVSIDPTKEFIASSSCDGTVKVWHVIDGTTEKTLNLLSKCSDPGQAKSLCRMCWSTDGEFLLIPVGNEIQVYLNSSWEIVKKLSHPNITDTINVMIMCPDGKHIAVGCSNGDIGIFELQGGKLIDKHSHPKHLPITSLAWNPNSWSELAFCDNVGQLGFLELVMADKKEQAPKVTNGTSIFDDADDDDALMTASGHVAPRDDIDKYLEDDDNSIDIGSIKRSLNLDNEDENSVAASRDGDDNKIAPAPVFTLPPDLFKPTPPQPPFQPGSTPEHLSSRFMMWNNVGIIRQYVSEEENSIDIEFHDTTTHHALHIDNKSEYVLADLSTQAVLLASKEEEDTCSKLFCMHFGSWDTHKEWFYTMPMDEEIKAITATDTWVAVATELRNIRIFSIGGLQRQVFSIPGNVVALASHGNQLVVVYHKGMGLPGDQHLGVSVICVHGRSRKMLINGDSLPLSPKSKLSWIGFSEEGSVFYMDVDGVVRMLNKQFAYTWSPVANTKQHVKGKSDHYWLVGVSERLQQIRCVPCKGSRFPATLPRPALAVLPFQLPLCEPESEKSQYEESYQRSYLFAKSLSDYGMDSEDVNKQYRESLIKLFAFAAKASRDFRALEVCDMMEDQSLLHLAATYATRLKRIQLAERVSEIMQRRQEEEEVEENEDDEERNIHFSQSLRSKGTTVNSDEENDNVNMTSEYDESTTPDVKRILNGPMLKTHTEKENHKVQEKTTPRYNPFKISRCDSSEKRSIKGTQVFDKIEKVTPKSSGIIAPLPVSIKKSTKKPSSGQAKLSMFNTKTEKLSSKTNEDRTVNAKSQHSISQETSEGPVFKKKISAFSLWFEEVKPELQEEQPDLSLDDVSQLATERFRNLPKEEREVWVQKAKSSSECGNVKKRKLSENDTDPSQETKAPQHATAKLAKFAKCD
ncbi:WD repeat and HMG-box DNA-binding protein 1 isoform X4 [Biomphalaria pfeifferi]|uniref:WD repeat and HMG-box DNA-binding protein 1 isoform X4 n=1 Tax=Biomphalaria pfeifferi TaxID=112525 RepID=A0AAD8BPM8_BIOPF|nr:WD repeat and HMG-box DNA-binding protein 1 isoform X4 [Biomphalaria pfeifferi]